MAAFTEPAMIQDKWGPSTERGKETRTPLLTKKQSQVVFSHDTFMGKHIFKGRPHAQQEMSSNELHDIFGSFLSHITWEFFYLRRLLLVRFVL